ncbi:MAG: hypothetical protein ACE1ZU_08510, partial [bacterium]
GRLAWCRWGRCGLGREGVVGGAGIGSVSDRLVGVWVGSGATGPAAGGAPSTGSTGPGIGKGSSG